MNKGKLISASFDDFSKLLQEAFDRSEYNDVCFNFIDLPIIRTATLQTEVNTGLVENRFNRKDVSNCWKAPSSTHQGKGYSIFGTDYRVNLETGYVKLHGGLIWENGLLEIIELNTFLRSVMYQFLSLDDSGNSGTYLVYAKGDPWGVEIY